VCARAAVGFRFILAVTFLVLLTAIPASAQIAVDSTASAQANFVTVMSWSHTVGTGSNRLLVVGLGEQVIGADQATSITYAGQNMTRQVLNGGGNPISEIWTLLAPPSGTAMIVVTFSGAVFAVGGSVSFTGVDQTTPIRASNSARVNGVTTGAMVSTNVTSMAGDLIVDAVAILAENPGGAAAAGQTERWNLNNDPIFGGGSTKPGDAGSTTMTWNLSGIGPIDAALAAISLIPAPLCTLACMSLTRSNDPNQCGAVVTYAPMTTGSCGTVVCSPASGSFFPVGTTTVTCKSNSGEGPEMCTFTVTVLDTQPPFITCPANVVVTASAGHQSAVVNYPAPTATDNCAVLSVSCNPPSGSSFPIGSTTVNCQATDESSNGSLCFFVVTVADREPPVITCPANIEITAPAGQTSTVVNYPPPVVRDNLPGATVSCAPASGATFQLGVTTVACTATDVSGNRSMCSFTVAVNGGPPSVRAVLPGGAPAIDYGKNDPVPPRRKPPKDRKNPCGFLTIENTGRAIAILTYSSVVRIGSDVTSGKITDPNERGLYQLSIINRDATETLVPVGTTLTIGIDQSVDFCLRFIPLIPAVATSTNNLPATAVLSEEINSRVNFTVQGASAAAVEVRANVDTPLVLIDPDNPRRQPQVTFARSGNEFRVSFSVFDSNLDTNRVKYEFLDSQNNVAAVIDNVDLADHIRQAGLVTGQSFTVDQRFTGASSNPELTGCRITVFDGETSVTGTATEGQSSTASLRQRAGRTTLQLPVVKMDRNN